MVETKFINRPKISIIVPVYNVEKTLSRCIESVISQTFIDWELLLIDDGSPDASGEICDRYSKVDNRIKVFHKRNGGPSSARNLGLYNATGDFIWFVDSDDWIEHDSIELLLHKIETFNSDICFFGLKPISQKNDSPVPFTFDSICKKSKAKFFCNKVGCAKAIKQIEMCGGMGWTCNKIFKRSIIGKYNLRFDTRFAIQEDNLFTLSYLLYVRSILVVNCSPYNYVIASGTLMSKIHTYQNTKERNLAMLNSRRKLCEKQNITDRQYVDWFVSDYSTRIVANLRQLKRSNLSYKNRVEEIKEVNSFISNHSVRLNGNTAYYKYIKWLPSCLLIKIL